jgi:nucleoid-associated protein YgaU
MSQKPTHNSKRRAPGDTAQSGQQDADWGFDPTEADPAVERKLAIALFVCLLVGFGFVFSQKFRLLRNDETQSAGIGEQAHATEGADPVGSTDSGSDEGTLAHRSAASDAASQSTVSPSALEVESPFYQRGEADTSSSEQEVGWTLAQAEATPQSAFPSSPAELPPLPGSSAVDGSDPFAGQDTAGVADASRVRPGNQQAAPEEPSVLVWNDESAVPSAPSQSEPPPDVLPQIAPQRSSSKPATQADPFAFDDEPSPPRPDRDIGSSSATNQLPHEKSQRPIFGDMPETAEPHSSDDAAAAKKIEALPAQSEPQAIEELDIADQPVPPSADTSAFDPFAGTAIEAPATAAAAEPSATSSHADTVGTESEEMFSPFPTADPPSAGQAEPSTDSAREPAGDPATVTDPFSFPQSSPAPPAEEEPGVDKAGQEHFPADVTLTPSQSAAAPTWPSGGSSHAPDLREPPVLFPSPDRHPDEEPARQSGPGGLAFESSDLHPTPATAESAGTSASTTPPNPFSVDAGASRPLISSTHDAQRVVGEREITVTLSDSFWSISEREYGTSRYFTALARYNQDRVAKPEHLQSGMKIIIPPPEVLEDRFPQLFRRTAEGNSTISPISGVTSSAAAEPGLFLDPQQRPFYRVGEQDTLSSIARQHLGRESRWAEIYELNEDRLKSPSALTIGTELKLPTDASGVRVSPAGGFDR